MTFWQDSALEPKRTYKFILSIPGGRETDGLKEFLVKKVKKPEWEIGSIEHKFLNHSFWYPGKTKWSALDVTVVDTVDPNANATQEIMRMLEASGYREPENPTTPAGWGTVSKAKAVRDALGTVKIKTIDSDGEIVETWTLKNAWIQKCALGELSYDDEAMVEISMTIQYDNAFVDVHGGRGKIPSNAS